VWDSLTNASATVDVSFVVEPAHEKLNRTCVVAARLVWCRELIASTMPLETTPFRESGAVGYTSMRIRSRRRGVRNDVRHIDEHGPVDV